MKLGEAVYKSQQKPNSKTDEKKTVKTTKKKITLLMQKL